MRTSFNTRLPFFGIFVNTCVCGFVNNLQLWFWQFLKKKERMLVKMAFQTPTKTSRIMLQVAVLPCMLVTYGSFRQHMFLECIWKHSLNLDNQLNLFICFLFCSSKSFELFQFVFSYFLWLSSVLNTQYIHSLFIWQQLTPKYLTSQFQILY